MNNKNIIKKTSQKESLKIYELESKKPYQNIASVNKKFLLDLPSRSISENLNNNTKKIEYTSPTSVWKNSVYSFNQNFVKNIPSVDNIINKMIKAFFTLNALDNNVKGKKSKLIQRRYKRLSLNRIFVSKSEIKHSNNTVNVTVYLFNKKKRSLLLSLEELYNGLSLNLSSPSRSWTKNNKFENLLSSNTLNENDKLWEMSKISPTLRPNKPVIKSNNLGIKSSIYNTINLAKYSREIISKKYGYDLDNNLKNERKSLYIKNKILYYNRLNNLTKYNIFKYLDTLNILEKSPKFKPNYNLLKDYFVYTNQYKLYNNKNFYSTNDINNLHINSNQISDLPVINYKTNISLKKINHSISKLKSLYKLFALYNNFSFDIKSGNRYNVTQMYYKKLLLNTYKLLKKSYKEKNSLLSKNQPLNLSNPNSFKSKFKNILPKSKNIKQDKLNNSNKLSLKNNRNTIILANNLNRIDRFFEKYVNVFQNTKNELIVPKKGNTLNNQIITDYKISFINDLLEKEFKYIYYLKLLSYNNSLFKNWLLFPLKSLMAKIYNKKVVLNLINLKYIHLNSDILTQAVNIKLRNFRKNSVVNVLKKAVKVVFISKVNIYACDEHSSMYKYIHNYYDKFRLLKLDIFKELGIINNGKITTEKDVNDLSKYNMYKPYVIKRLNHIQTSTINFIRFKSVFGVRLEAAGRLTKRSTASRALFKFRHKGTLKNNPTINKSLSATMIKNHQLSNLQYTNISSKTRNGAFGLKGWINSN